MTTTYPPSDSLPNGYPTTSTARAYANGQSMDGRPGEYSHQPEQNSAQHYSSGQDVKYNPATPDSNYSLNPSSARSGTFPDYNLPRSAGYPDGSQRYQANGTPNGAAAAAAGNMAQPQSPSSMSSADHGPSAAHHQQALAQQTDHSNPPIPVDPSIAQSSPTYPPTHHYSPYPTTDPHHMQYQTPPMYARPDYSAGPPYSAPHQQPLPYGHVATSGYAYRPQGGHPLSTVYSFVPIPGTHQQKRPRRRYEEIERMYKCGWNGCEKAYGTLNHLNAHVTMQSHGSKRTPEEFKEIRKEWKARKKEEENARKADEERVRQQAATQAPPQHPDGTHPAVTAADGAQQGHGPPSYGGSTVRQLPPLGYAPAAGQVNQYNGQQGMDGMPQYAASGSAVPYSGGYPPASPYPQQPNSAMYAHPQSSAPLQSPAAAGPQHNGDTGRT